MTDRSVLLHKTTQMLAMQDEMNSRVDSDWLERNREWYRAIWIECAELMDHYGGWKWWKHASPDIEQVVLEIVDIWHFGLSMYIDGSGEHSAAAARIVDAWQRDGDEDGFHAAVERLAAAALREKRFAVEEISYLLRCCDRDFDDLFRAYVGKNVLNVFRQDHGYRSGEYNKTWHGQEDNEVLVEVLLSLDSNAADFKSEVYTALAERYAAV